MMVTRWGSRAAGEKGPVMHQARDADHDFAAIMRVHHQGALEMMQAYQVFIVNYMSISLGQLYAVHAQK